MFTAEISSCRLQTWQASGDKEQLHHYAQRCGCGCQSTCQITLRAQPRLTLLSPLPCYLSLSLHASLSLSLSCSLSVCLSQSPLFLLRSDGTVMDYILVLRN